MKEQTGDATALSWNVSFSGIKYVCGSHASCTARKPLPPTFSLKVVLFSRYTHRATTHWPSAIKGRVHRLRRKVLGTESSQGPTV